MTVTYPRSRRAIWSRKLLYPGHTLPTAAAPVVVAAGLAMRDDVFALAPAVVAFLCGWLIQFAGVMTDNYTNLVREPEDREHPELVEAVRTGLITLQGLKATIVACYGAAVLAGIYLVHIGGWPVITIGVLSIVASSVYSAGSWPIGRMGLADPLFFLFFGVVSVVGTYYVQSAAVLGTADWRAGFPTTAFAVGLPIGALITSILVIDDIRDRHFDVVKGKQTIAVRFGARWSRAELIVLMTFAYAAPFWFWLRLGLGSWTLLPVLTLPLAYATARAVLARDTFSQLMPLTPRAALLALGYSVLFSVGLAAS